MSMAIGSKPGFYERHKELSPPAHNERITLLSVGQHGEVRELVINNSLHLPGALSLLFIELPHLRDRMKKMGIDCHLITYK